MIEFYKKRGETFKARCQHKVDGAAASIAGLEIVSGISDHKGFEQTFETIIVDESAGQYQFGPVSTSAWPIGIIYWDLRIYKDGLHVYSNTRSFAIRLNETPVP